MGIWGSIKKASSGVGSGVMGAGRSVGRGAGDAWDYSTDAVGGVYNDITGVTSAREIGAAQEQALGQAREAQQQGHQRSQNQLSPYAETGGQALEGLSFGVRSGGFDPGAFNYGGEQTGQFNYQGAGQQGDTGYRGDPNITSDYQGGQQGDLNYFNGQQGA